MKYKDAGVDIDHGDNFKAYIKSLNKRVGGFAGLIEIPKGYKNPLLVASVDNVGTKLKLAVRLGINNTVGEDIVNHCINDIFAVGAVPIYFMDYIGTSKLKLEQQKEVINGITNACRKNNIILAGGETAELPEFYSNEDEYDLAGFITGIVEKSKVITGKSIVPGDKLVGFASNGLHTNGYSLARKIIKDKKLSLNKKFPELSCTLGEALLKIHREYKSLLLPYLPKIKGLVHITGGGFYGNIPRILPSGIGVKIHRNWTIPPIFKLFQKEGKVDDREMYRVFNMGIGMIAIVKDPSIFSKIKEKHWIIGEAVKGSGVKII